MTGQTGCLCCKVGVSFERPRMCPECGHVFQGNGWEGIDAHWRAKHEARLPYQEFWKLLCDRHRGGDRR
jgi:hypothetical protein